MSESTEPQSEPDAQSGTEVNVNGGDAEVNVNGQGDQPSEPSSEPSGGSDEDSTEDSTE